MDADDVKCRGGFVTRPQMDADDIGAMPRACQMDTDDVGAVPCACPQMNADDVGAIPCGRPVKCEGSDGNERDGTSAKAVFEKLFRYRAEGRMHGGCRCCARRVGRHNGADYGDL